MVVLLLASVVTLQGFLENANGSKVVWEVVRV